MKLIIIRKSSKNVQKIHFAYHIFWFVFQDCIGIFTPLSEKVNLQKVNPGWVL